MDTKEVREEEEKREEGIGRGRGAKGMGELKNENIPEENLICNCVTPAKVPHSTKMEYLYLVKFPLQNSFMYHIVF